jgi:hypothetical protein
LEGYFEFCAIQSKGFLVSQTMLTSKGNLLSFSIAARQGPSKED